MNAELHAPNVVVVVNDEIKWKDLICGICVAVLWIATIYLGDLLFYILLMGLSSSATVLLMMEPPDASVYQYLVGFFCVAIVIAITAPRLFWNRFRASNSFREFIYYRPMRAFFPDKEKRDAFIHDIASSITKRRDERMHLSRVPDL